MNVTDCKKRRDMRNIMTQVYWLWKEKRYEKYHDTGFCLVENFLDGVIINCARTCHNCHGKSLYYIFLEIVQMCPPVVWFLSKLEFHAVQCFDTNIQVLMWCGVGSGMKGHFVRKWTHNLFGDEKVVIIYL